MGFNTRLNRVDIQFYLEWPTGRTRAPHGALGLIGRDAVRVSDHGVLVEMAMSNRAGYYAYRVPLSVTASINDPVSFYMYAIKFLNGRALELELDRGKHGHLLESRGISVDSDTFTLVVAPRPAVNEAPSAVNEAPSANNEAPQNKIRD